jgi:NAD(P)H-dependent FMN reductase
MTPVPILVFSGSDRRDSLNLRLAGLAARRLKALGATVTHVRLSDYALPIYDGDLETQAGVPDGAAAFRGAIDAHAGTFIACPEYNSGYTPLLKNALDWASRVKNPAGQMTPVFGGKVVALGAASPGFRGGYRALTQLRTALELGYGALVVPEMAAVANAATALDDGAIKDAVAAGLFEAGLKRLVALASAGA